MTPQRTPFRNLASRLAGGPRAITEHEDGDVVFIMPVFRDVARARGSLQFLRRAYPHSRLVVISDGDEQFPGDAFERDFGAEYVLGANLYALDCGGRTIHRLLDRYMAAPGRFLVRLDTDARVDRRFDRLPDRDGLYGSLGRRSGTVQGGCVLLSHGSAERLFRSEIFLSDRLLDPVATWGRFSTPDNLRRKLDQGRIAYDKVLHWGCIEMGVPVRSWGEIRSVWKQDAAFRAEAVGRPGRYAIIHPADVEAD